MRVVLDTNVIVSATLIRGGNEDQILRAWRRGDFDLVLSPPILDERRESRSPRRIDGLDATPRRASVDAREQPGLRDVLRNDD